MTRRRDFLAQGNEPNALDEHALFQSEPPDQEPAGDEATGEYAPADADAAAAEDQDWDGAELESPGDEPRITAATHRAGRRHAATQDEQEPMDHDEPVSTGTPKLPLLLGGLLLFGGLALAAGGATAPAKLQGLLDTLARAGVQPALLMLGGLVLLAIGGLTRRVAGSDQRIDQLQAMAGDSGAQQQELSAAVQKLLEELGSTDDSIESGGLHRIIHILHRLDEKTNNLTRAFKMYGKPLIDIAKQVTQVEVAVRETHEALGAQAQQTAQSAAAWPELRQAMQAADQNVRTGFERTEAALRELGDRDDRAAFTQLEQQLTALRGQLDEAVGTRLAELQQGFDESARAVTAGIDKVLHGMAQPHDDAKLTGALDAIRKDLTALAQQVRAVGSARPAASSAAPAPAPAATPARASEPAPTASAPAAEPRGEGPAPAGLAHSIAGTKSGSNKNVMSAIEKLKSLRK